MGQSKTHVKLLKKKSAFWISDFYNSLSLKTQKLYEVWKENFKPLLLSATAALFVWEISKNEVNNSKFSFCNSTYSLIIAKNHGTLTN